VDKRRRAGRFRPLQAGFAVRVCGVCGVRGPPSRPGKWLEKKSAPFRTNPRLSGRAFRGPVKVRFCSGWGVAAANRFAWSNRFGN
jgi:hypothetical protein